MSYELTCRICGKKFQLNKPGLELALSRKEMTLSDAEQITQS